MIYRGRHINAMPTSPRVLVNPYDDLDQSQALLAARSRTLLTPTPGVVSVGNLRGF